MYNLMFVDDEIHTLNMMSNLLPWERMGVQLIACCSNALKALNVMIDERVDILVTDIKMPVVDGLELVSRTKEMYPDVECMVLSGYEEFQLAKMAIDKGVTAYMLKPCEKEELESGIRKCIENIERKRGFTDTDLLQRNGEIEKISVEIAEIKSVQEDEIRTALNEIIAHHQDVSRLRDAIIPVILQYGDDMTDAKFKIRKLTKASSSREILDIVTDTLERVNSLQTEQPDPIIAKMVDYANKNYNNPNLNVQFVAENVLYLSKSYVGRRFLKKMGMKFSEFLLQTRMERAIQILQEEGSNAESIASEVGLGNNVQYFYRLFKQYTGMTFGEYRENISAKPKQEIGKYSSR